MPSVNAFRKGFDFRSEWDAGGGNKYKLLHPANIGHVVVTQNRKYEFPTTIQLERASKSNKSMTEEAVNKEKKALLEVVKNRLCSMKKQIIYSEYGSPYECYYDENSFKVEDFDEKEHVMTIACKGFGVRTFDIPTESQKRNQERKEGMDESAQEHLKHRINNAKAKGYRVVKSHFNTGKCDSCGEQIHIGEQIVHKQRSEEEGWSHLDCVFPPHEPVKKGEDKEEDQDEENEDEEEEVEEEAEPKSSRSKKTTLQSRGSAKKKAKASEDEEDEEAEAPPSKKKGRASKSTKVSPKRARRTKA